MCEAKDPAEWLRFFQLWHQPGDASGRIADAAWRKKAAA